jgi:hypothetical protein
MRKFREQLWWKWLLCCVIVMFANSFHAMGREPGIKGDTIIFSNYKWVVKESKGKRTGPGNNYFSGKKHNVWVDELGRLHLRLAYRDGKWYCPEVQSVDNFGYGRYHFYLEPFTSPLAKEIVVGIFTYDHNDSLNYHKEADIEFSYWNKKSNKNAQYVIQPFEDEAHRFNIDFTRRTHHVIDIRKKKIFFQSDYERGLNPDSAEASIAFDVKVPPYSFRPEHVNINVWLYHSAPPENEKEFEVIISEFRFEQSRIHRLLRKLNKKKR